MTAKLTELASASGVDWEDDRAVLDLLEKSAAAVESAGRELAFGAVSAQLEALLQPLDAKARADILALMQSKLD